jgi:DNA-binding NarL/FixJ family response regulator
VLLDIQSKCNPEGLLVKSDFLASHLLEAFDTVYNGGKYYSATVQQIMKEAKTVPKILDSYNRQILTLLSKGIKTKNMPEHLNLSKSAIDKRKVLLKQFFGIEKGTDEDILREARIMGWL